jgi:hypothetical protein
LWFWMSPVRVRLVTLGFSGFGLRSVLGMQTFTDLSGSTSFFESAEPRWTAC